MRVLSVTAQKPCSTGSGVYLTEVVRSLAKMGVSQAVVAGVTREDRVDMPEGVTVYPVYFSSEKLPYPVVGKRKSGYYLMPSFVLPDGADKSTLSC